jgi:hypothetical protein
MKELDFDPVDLAMLACGFAQGAAPHDCSRLSITRAEMLIDVARMLHTRWLQMDSNEWSGVWAYDVAEPLGVWIGEQFAAVAKDGGDFPDDAPILAQIEFLICNTVD